MYPASFEYHRATSIDDAIARLAANPDAKILAGGHSLIPAMKLRLAQPGELVDLAGVPGLTGIEVDGGARIGAMATYDQLRDTAALAARWPIFPEVVGVIGDQQVRAHGTIGGSLAHNDPAADMTAVFLALGGEVVAVGPGGERTIAADDMFIELWTTALQPDEVLTEVRLPELSGTTLMAYEKQSHPASGYAIAGVAVVLTVENNTVATARIAITGATSVPTRATASETALTGKALDDVAIAAAVNMIADGLDINGDLAASPEYRTQLLRVLTKKALTRLARS